MAIIMLNTVPDALKIKFKAECALQNKSMTQVLIQMMENFTTVSVKGSDVVEMFFAEDDE